MALTFWIIDDFLESICLDLFWTKLEFLRKSGSFFVTFKFYENEKGFVWAKLMPLNGYPTGGFFDSI